jgi:hypothetical protein
MYEGSIVGFPAAYLLFSCPQYICPVLGLSRLSTIIRATASMNSISSWGSSAVLLHDRRHIGLISHIGGHVVTVEDSCPRTTVYHVYYFLFQNHGCWVNLMNVGDSLVLIYQLRWAYLCLIFCTTTCVANTVISCRSSTFCKGRWSRLLLKTGIVIDITTLFLYKCYSHFYCSKRTTIGRSQKRSRGECMTLIFRPIRNSSWWSCFAMPSGKYRIQESLYLFLGKPA